MTSQQGAQKKTENPQCEIFARLPKWCQVVLKTEEKLRASRKARVK